MRIAVGGIEHETCGFAAESGDRGEVTLERLARRFLRGEELCGLGDANTIVDGFVRGVREAGDELVPLLWVDANTGPPVSRASFERVASELLDRLRRALPVDGVLLSLHGAFAAEGIDDADGAILRAVRQLVGADCPVIAVHDLHGNITAEMAAAADILVVERTYPHVDMAERALHASRLIARIARGALRPTQAFRPLPMLWSAAKMIDAEPPMSQVVARLHEIDARVGVVSASIGVGYQWIDNPTVGSSVLVTTDGDQPLADSIADELALWIWDRRSLWQRPPLDPRVAIAEGEREGRFPIILADQGDNTGGGAPGDSTELLRLFLERSLVPSAVLYVVDPEAARQAAKAGVGQEIDVLVGGRSSMRVGPPVPMRARVRALSEGRFTYDGPMWAGVVGEMGLSAWLEQRGVHVVVISERIQPIDLAFSRSLGLDCGKMRYLALKSTGHFRSGFAPIAGSIFNVDTASPLSHDFRQLPYTRLGRKVYPLDEEAQLFRNR